MADLERICARLCLLTREAWNDTLPPPFMRANVHRMIRYGAIEGLTLRRVPQIREEYYARAEALLSRSAPIYDALENCMAQGYRVILPEDDEWPVNLCALGLHMPQILFIRGNISLITRRSVAVAGSRRIEEKTASVAKCIGAEIAKSGNVLVCGGAQGVDRAAQEACLNAGGNLILVPAYPCGELLRQPCLHGALEDGRLLLACETWPEEGFSAKKALTRNHAIYALGDAAIAVAARKGVGGTWRGASDCLRGGYTPLFAVDAPEYDFAGTRKLIQLGAHPLDISRPIVNRLFAKGGESV